jgi:hypothetical protein
MSVGRGLARGPSLRQRAALWHAQAAQTAAPRGACAYSGSRPDASIWRVRCGVGLVSGPHLAQDLFKGLLQGERWLGGVPKAVVCTAQKELCDCRRPGLTSPHSAAHGCQSESAACLGSLTLEDSCPCKHDQGLAQVLRPRPWRDREGRDKDGQAHLLLCCSSSRHVQRCQSAERLHLLSHGA